MMEKWLRGLLAGAAIAAAAVSLTVCLAFKGESMPLERALAEAMRELLEDDWLANRLPDYDLSRMEPPSIEVLPRPSFSERGAELLGNHGRHEGIEALYDRRRNAISFDGDTFSEMTPGLAGLLAHEVTHAAQTANGYNGPSREFEAYRVQQDWRKAHGLPHRFPEPIRQSLEDIDRRNGIDRSPAQRGLYRDK